MIHDAIALIGLSMLGYGVWLLSKPFAFIVIGVLLITYAVLCEYKKPKKVLKNEPS